MFDVNEPVKQAAAQALFEQEVAAGRIVLSTQILQEFYVTVAKKMAERLSPAEAETQVRNFAVLPVVKIDTGIILSAIRLHQSDQISFWDALIVETARTAGASRLYTEDLQHGREIDGLRIENPFL